MRREKNKDSYNSAAARSLNAADKSGMSSDFARFKQMLMLTRGEHVGLDACVAPGKVRCCRDVPVICHKSRRCATFVRRGLGGEEDKYRSTDREGMFYLIRKDCMS